MFNKMHPWSLAAVGLLLIGFIATVWDPRAGARFIGFVCGVGGAWVIGSKGFMRS